MADWDVLGDYEHEQTLLRLDDDDVQDLAEAVVSDKKVARICKMYGVSEAFIEWFKLKHVKQRAITDDEEAAINKYLMEKQMSCEEIAAVLSLPLALVQHSVENIKNSDKVPLPTAVDMQCNAASEHPQYLLPCQTAQIGLQGKHAESDTCSTLLRGGCTCSEESTRVYNLMVIGQTGSGKTTWINSFINFLVGITFFDPFRYCVIDERHIKAERATSQSATSEVTIYHTPWRWIKRPIKKGERACVNLIDTPGGADTRGLSMEELIFEMIHTCLKLLQQIDYILIVNKSSDTRLLSSSQFVYQRIQNLWASNISDRILAMYTFSDGKRPNAEKAIEDAGIHVTRGFRFNNSAIWEKDESQTTMQFFNLGFANFKEFCDFIAEDNKPPVSLSLTRDVLQQRKLVEEISFDAMRRSQLLTKNMTDIQRFIFQAYAHSKQINSNKNYVKVYEISTNVRVDCSHNVTQCRNCRPPHGICHNGCGYGDGEDKKNCCAMNSAGICMNCNCHWTDHINAHYYWKPGTKKVTEDVGALRILYGEAVAGLDNTSLLILKLLDEQLKCVNDFELCQKRIKACNDFLREHALRKTAYVSTDFFKQQIEVLKAQGGKDVDAQIQNLQQMIDRQNAIRQTLSGSVEMEFVDEESSSKVEVQIQREMFAGMKEHIESMKQDLHKQSQERFKDYDATTSIDGMWKSVKSMFGRLF